MYRVYLSISFLFLSISLLQGCMPGGVSYSHPAEYIDFFQALDVAVSKADVGNAAYHRIRGYPYLRSDRFLTVIKSRAKTDTQKTQWVELLLERGTQAIRSEIHALPDPAVRRLSIRFSVRPDRKEIFEKAIKYSIKQYHHDKKGAAFYEKVRTAATYPSEYIQLLKIIGLYPITSLPVATLTDKARSEFRTWYDKPYHQLIKTGNLRVYSPDTTLKSTTSEIKEWIDISSLNPLKIPILSFDIKIKLAAAFAPIFYVDTAADYDYIGKMVWKQRALALRSDQPTVYYYFSYVFHKGDPVIQINYVIWFSARSGKATPKIEQGQLDGITVRMSLDAKGTLFMMDIMNNCGCYHLFVPQKARIERLLPQPLKSDPFVAQWLPSIPPNRRIGIRINSGWHQVQRVIAAKSSKKAQRYRLVPYDVLEMLPQTNGRTESMFNSKGIAKGTERIEQALLFSMGLPYIGSMRQRGHHGISFFREWHFDDPNLFEWNFKFKQ